MSSQHAPLPLSAILAEISELPAAERSPYWLSGWISEQFLAHLDGLIHALGGIDAVCAAASAAYTAYVQPLDLPGVPAMIEPAVDEALKRAIEQGLRAAHAAIHREG